MGKRDEERDGQGIGKGTCEHRGPESSRYDEQRGSVRPGDSSLGSRSWSFIITLAIYLQYFGRGSSDCEDTGVVQDGRRLTFPVISRG